ncbi:hypothetical protein ACLB1M_04485 [Escherichia coli]
MTAVVNRRFSLFGVVDVRLLFGAQIRARSRGSGSRKLKGRWKINVLFAGGVYCR